MTRKDIDLLAEAFSSTKPKTINNMNEQIEQIIQFIKEQIAIEERRVEKAHWDTQESHAQGAIEAFENVIKFIEEL